MHFSQGGHHIWHKGWKLTQHDDGLLELVSFTGELYQSRTPPLDFLLE